MSTHPIGTPFTHKRRRVIWGTLQYRPVSQLKMWWLILCNWNQSLWQDATSHKGHMKTRKRTAYYKCFYECPPNQSILTEPLTCCKKLNSHKPDVPVSQKMPEASLLWVSALALPSSNHTTAKQIILHQNIQPLQIQSRRYIFESLHNSQLWVHLLQNKQHILISERAAHPKQLIIKERCICFLLITELVSWFSPSISTAALNNTENKRFNWTDPLVWMGKKMNRLSIESKHKDQT